MQTILAIQFLKKLTTEQCQWEIDFPIDPQASGFHQEIVPDHVAISVIVCGWIEWTRGQAAGHCDFQQASSDTEGKIGR
jgi:hypothetical protein